MCVSMTIDIKIYFCYKMSGSDSFLAHPGHTRMRHVAYLAFSKITVPPLKKGGLVPKKETTDDRQPWSHPTTPHLRGMAGPACWTARAQTYESRAEYELNGKYFKEGGAASPAATNPIPLPRASLSFLVKQPGGHGYKLHSRGSENGGVWGSGVRPLVRGVSEPYRSRQPGAIARLASGHRHAQRALVAGEGTSMVSLR